MTESGQEIIKFELKCSKEIYDPAREARARDLRNWREFGLAPIDFILPPRRISRASAPLIKFPISRTRRQSA